MNIDDINAIQSEALAKGLIFGNIPRQGAYHLYKLQCMTVSGPPEPVKILELIRFVRTFSSSEEKGPHQAFLRLSLKRRYLNRHPVEWQQNSIGSDQDARLTLEEWLAEQGYPYIAAQAAA